MATISKTSGREAFLANAEATIYAEVEALPTINQQGDMPDSHAFLAWFSCLFCCWPIGLYAIATSSSVHDKWLKGDFDGAYQASGQAQKASLAAIFVGLIVIVLYQLTIVSGQ